MGQPITVNYDRTIRKELTFVITHSPRAMRHTAPNGSTEGNSYIFFHRASSIYNNILDPLVTVPKYIVSKTFTIRVIICNNR